MIKYGTMFVGLLALSVGGVAKPSQVHLERNVWVQVHQAQQKPVTSQVLQEQLRQNVALAKRLIHKQMKFPSHVKDPEVAGVIFGCLMPVMFSYNELRAHDEQAAREQGARLAQEEFVSKDGRTFKLDEFIGNYLSNITIPSLAQDFSAFKTNIYNDLEATK